MKRFCFTLMAVLAVLTASADAPYGSGTYYKAADGKKGAALKTALRGIVQTTVERRYDDLWTDFRTTDKRSDGKVWDMYSNITNFTFGTDQAGSFQKEGDVYNREHSFPKSWFGGEVMPMYTDLHHMYPTDGYVNNRRGNLPFGTTNGGTYKSSGGFSKVGACTYNGYTGEVFEPNDEYKGDLARTYFYMVTRYEEKLADWYNNNSESRATLDGSAYPAFQDWQLNMLLEWAAKDPVSAKETARNNAVYGIQKNRNPFIDYPGLEQYIWGNKKDVAFSYDNYVRPDGSSSGSGTGGDEPDPGTDPGDDPTLAADTYKLTITGEDFVSGGYAANNKEKTSTAVCTTDASKTFEVKWKSYNICLDGSRMQWKSGSGYLYNITDLSTIDSVTVTAWSGTGTYTTYYGIAEAPSVSTEVGGGFFKTVVGSSTGKTKSVEVVFTIAGGDTPDPDPDPDPDPGIEEISDVYKWVETPIVDLETANVFIIVGTNSSGSFALPNDGRTDTSPVATPVTVEDGRITSEVADNLLWHISGTAANGYVFYPYGIDNEWLYCIGDNKGVRIGSNSNKTFKESSEGYLQHVGTSRFLGIYNSQDWRSYTSINTNIAGQTFKFYKRVPVQIVEIGEAGYATMVAKANVSVPEGVEAYAAQVNAGSTSVHLEPVEASLPKGAAVVLKGAAGTYEFPFIASAASVLPTNDLVASDGKVSGDGTTIYALGVGKTGAYAGKAGFYLVQEGVKIPEGKAYLEVTTTAMGGEAPEFYGFSDEDDATAISDELRVKSEEMEGAVYNLAGQRVDNSKLPHGIYIKNGRKVLK